MDHVTANSLLAGLVLTEGTPQEKLGTVVSLCRDSTVPVLTVTLLIVSWMEQVAVRNGLWSSGGFVY